MDNNQNIAENVHPQASQTNRLSIKRYAIPVAFLVLGLVLGVVISKILPQKEVSIPQPNNIYKSSPLKTADPKTLIDPTQILQHPVFTEWLGSVEGILVSKTNDSFTIERGGKQLTIYTQEALTGFYGKPNIEGQALPKITLKEIPVGTYLRGGVTITRLSLKSIAERHIFANIFTIVDNEPTKTQ